MFQNNLQKFIKKARNIRLTDTEKFTIKQRILNFIENNPARVSVRSRLGFRSSVFLLNQLNFVKYAAVLLVLAVLISGGIVMGAEKALPGDILYPVKVGVNEEVRGWLLVSEEARADWEVKRVQRRLEEAEDLADRGFLDTDARSIIEANFQAHSDRVKNRLAKFEDKENFNVAADVSSNFETALEAHEKILAKLIEEETDDELKVEIKPIKTKVGSEARAARKSREKNENNVSVNVKKGAETQTEVESKLKATENKLEKIRKFISRAETELETETSTQAKARLVLAEQAVTEGRIKIESKAYGEAFLLFQKAIRVAQEAKLLVEANQKLEVKIKINGDLNGNGGNNSRNGNGQSDDKKGKDLENEDIDMSDQ